MPHAGFESGPINTNQKTIAEGNPSYNASTSKFQSALRENELNSPEEHFVEDQVLKVNKIINQRQSTQNGEEDEAVQI